MPAPTESLRLTLPSDTGWLHLVTGLARNAASAAGLDDDDAEKIALATDEAVTNVIQHAYHGRAGEIIELIVDLYTDGLEIRVVHDGDALDESSLSRDYDPAQLIKAHRKGGLGIVLMRRLVDRVDYRTTDDSRNECCLRMFKRSADETEEGHRSGH